MKTAVGMVVYQRDCFYARAAHAVGLADSVDLLQIWVNEGPKPTDELMAKLRPGLKIHHNPENIGQDAAIKQMHKQFFAEGAEYVFTMEDGCLVMPWTFEKMVNVLENEPEIGVVCCSLTQGPTSQLFPMEFAPEDFVPKMLKEPSAKNPWNEEMLKAWNPHPWLEWTTLPAPDPFLWGLRRDTYERVGPIDDGYWQGWWTLNDYAYLAREQGIHSATVWDAFAITWDREVPRPWHENNPAERVEWATRGNNHLAEKWGPKGWKRFLTNFKGMDRHK